MTSRCCARDDGGAAAVEFVLIFFFVLGPLLYAIVAFGFVLYEQATVTQLARVGARTAAICSARSGATSAGCSSDGAGAVSTYTPPGFAGYLLGSPVVDASNCFGSGGAATATVQAKPVLSLFSLTVTGRSATPCGG